MGGGRAAGTGGSPLRGSVPHRHRLTMGKPQVKKLAIIAAFCGSFICSSADAKTFVGVLWPMGGPIPAIGLVELAGELRMIPDVEVKTYLHQEWPNLVDDIASQPPGTHTVVVGYSLGANASVFVANKSKYVDLIIALQPSMLSWDPPLTGKVGRMIEVYNPNPWMTFGGMGSRKLIGDNIEYIANNDSHPGAQFNSDFRNLVKTEITKFTTNDHLEIAQAQAPKPVQVAQLSRSPAPRPVDNRPVDNKPVDNKPDAKLLDERVAQQLPAAKMVAKTVAKSNLQIAEAQVPSPPTQERAAEQRPVHEPRDLMAKGNVQVADADADIPLSIVPEQVAQERPRQQASNTAFLDQLSSSVNSGDLSVQRGLTVEDMKDYAERAYHRSELMTTASN
jgi:hypothetical protein